MSRRIVMPIAALVFSFAIMCLASALSVGGARAVAASSNQVARRMAKFGECKALNPAPQINCENLRSTDDDVLIAARCAIAQAVYEKLREDNNLTDQVNNGQINVDINPRTMKLTLFGFAVAEDRVTNDLSRDDSAIRAAMDRAGVVATCRKGIIVNKLKVVKPKECGEGQTQCGQLCIPEEMQCNLPPR